MPGIFGITAAMRNALALTGALVMCCAAGLAVKADAVAPGLAMLDRIAPGTWELRSRDEQDPPVRMCLRNGHPLIQLRHPRMRCARTVVDDTGTDVTVQYTCPGRGYGRTHIRLENESLMQIDSQGIAGGLPFVISAEARRVGPCRH